MRFTFRASIQGTLAAVGAILLAGCVAADGGEGNSSPTPAPAGGSGAAGLVLYSDTLTTSIVASTLDRQSAWRFTFDPVKEYITGIDCTRDGTRAAYLKVDNTTRTNRVIVFAEGERRELEAPGRVSSIAWSPDGSQIVYTSFNAETMENHLGLLDPETGETSVLDTSDGTIGSARWSPSGDRIVFDRSTPAGNQVFVHDPATGENSQISSGLFQAFSPDWSPDGSTIVYSSFLENGASQLFTAPAAGGAEQQLNDSEVLKVYPRWSLDGSLIAYVGTIPIPTVMRLPGPARHNLGVFTMNPDGSGEQAFTDIALDAWLVGWCAPGPWLQEGGWAQE
jgi:Tol biopolymer transport system component